MRFPRLPSPAKLNGGALAVNLRRCLLFAIYLTFLASSVRVFAQATQTNAVILTIEGKAEWMKTGSSVWNSAQTNQVLLVGDRLRTGEKSRATVRLSDLSVLRLGASTTIEIEPPDQSGGKPTLRMNGGSGFFHGRDKPRENQFRTPLVSAAIRGTEFSLEVAPDGRTVLTLIDGAVDLANEQGQIALVSGEQGLVEFGKAPTRSPALETTRAIQWVLYYPAVLDADELGLSPNLQQTLSDSLSAYRSGDLLAALGKYPPNRNPEDIRERIYLAALLLSVGQVADSERLLGTVPAPSEGREAVLTEALRKLIDSVRQPHLPSSAPPANAANVSTNLATSWLAESYAQQSRLNLIQARVAARKAAELAPHFGFAWARLAELEFSFGQTRDAATAVDKSLQAAPSLAYGLALKGFLLAARNETKAAISWFDRAIAVDGALGQAWLGRGLCRIRLGHADAGREDLQTAAALEPQRSSYRSYLSKAFANQGDTTNAVKEIRLAQQFDPNDPTSWLYAALLDQQGNAINDAARDLERSQELNDNRRVYRSGLLLDQDRAVRSANLAGIYKDAGMFDFSVREATRAVNTDYANYSAHLFLANSYDALRDPRQINLRYETPWLTEFLVANLLAPVGGGSLSPALSQQEYSKLFERDRLGLSSSTEYFSGGNWVQSGSQFGTFGNTSYSLDSLYRADRGQRRNNDQNQFTFSAKATQQITPQDSLYLQTIYYDFESGDLTQYFDQNSAHVRLRVEEHQDPMVLAGFHHEWGPGVHTLFLAGRLEDTFAVRDPDSTVLVLNKNSTGQTTGVSVLPTALDYRNEFEAFTSELQQIWQRERNALILGGRYQLGGFDTRSQFEKAALESDFQRLSFYAYDHWHLFDPLWVTAGVSYDLLSFPLNYRSPPLSDAGKTDERVSPKAGLIWTPLANTVLRGSYTRSLGGVSYDQSFRLEPVQVAGFNQAFRSLIPESVSGSLAGAHFDTWGVALDQKIGRSTYVGVEADLLESRAERAIGDITSTGFPPALRASNTRQNLDFRERDLTMILNQLIGRSWSLGANYRLSAAELTTVLPEIPLSLTRGASTDQEATLHQLNLSTRFNHASGVFGLAEAVWSKQSNRGYTPEQPGDDFWQFNVYAGYRFFRRHAELRLGVLNLSDQDYRLNPLTFYQELPRERTFTAGFRFYF